jgi:peptide/nickel transport system permease protein
VTDGAGQLPVAARSKRRRSWWPNDDPIAVAAIVVLLGLVVMAIFGPLFVGDPVAQDLSERLTPPMWFEGGSSAHPLGTDNLGRDLLARVVYGARISLLVASAALALSAAVGTVLGLLAGHYRGLGDDAVMRVADTQLAIPYVLLAITLVSLIGPSTWTVVLAMLLYGWVIYARLVRGEVLSLRQEEFVLAAQVQGASDLRVMFRHLLPNLVTPLVIISSLELANLIIIESALGFLGLGIPPPTPTWGGMLASGASVLTTGHWWVAVVPGVAICITIMSINVIGDWLRDRLDPKGAA